MSTPADPATAADPSDDDRVLLFDTTLRDGEQSPGISLDEREKVEIALQLGRLGVDVIEAGFPIASPGDFAAVRAIARASFDGPTVPVIAGLARAQAPDIDRAGEAVRDAERPRIHTFISTSDIHIRHQMRNSREDVVSGTRAAVAHARSLVEDVEFSPMDATRSDPAFTAEVIQVAIDEGATTINVPDTVGYTTPAEYHAFLTALYAHVPALRDVVLSVHCHDDLGLAVANSIAGLEAGARQVECAVNGIGERAGNASIEEIIMLLRTRRDHYRMDTNAVSTEIARTSRLVSRLTGYPVQPNKAIVGRNAFSHESGIHQDGVLKERETFEIMDARTIGIEDANQIVLGKHSGRHALRQALEELGYKLDGDQLRQAFDRFKEIADRKKQVTAMDLEALVTHDVAEVEGAYELVSYELEASSGAKTPHARVVVRIPSGEQRRGEFPGDGPVDAVFRAINAAVGLEPRLREYRVDAVTAGQDALGQASVVVEMGAPGAPTHQSFDGVVSGERRTGAGQAVDTDVIHASAIAYLRAVGVAERRARTAADEALGATP